MAPVIGVVGGLGPEGTVHYYRKLTARFGTLPVEQRPGILVDHVWIDRFSSLLGAGAINDILALFTESLSRLHRAGAGLAMIAAVTPHKFLTGLQRASPIPIVDLVAATRDDILAAGYRSVGLLGTRATLTEPFFRGEIERAGVRVIVPPEEGIRYLNDLIFGPLARGEKTDDTQRKLSQLVDHMSAAGGFDALVVACTDLMDLLEPSVPMLDPIESHLSRAARELSIGRR